MAITANRSTGKANVRMAPAGALSDTDCRENHVRHVRLLLRANSLSSDQLRSPAWLIADLASGQWTR